MAALHEALKALAPVKFDDVPTSPEGLDGFLSDTFASTQLILDSIPIASHDEALSNRPRSNTSPDGAQSASEMSPSAARSTPPAADRIALQKEWGKPMKLSQKENQLGVSVYKASGKDGRGAWFARRSVHEGLGFTRFIRAFEKEFPTSLAVQGAPGEGNVRGIGAETRVEDKTAPTKGKLEVYQLSAQFPGPTTPRDFVTLLLTSTKALKPQKEGELIPRHYMIVSKPCDHSETQPRNGFIRGQYESVEFIREIPRKLKASASTTDLGHSAHKHGANLEQEVLLNNAKKREHLQSGYSAEASSNSRGTSPMGRKRSHTVDVPDIHTSPRPSFDDHDPEDNPVEWIMVTRSDPGGSVPRFMVERGTPASICADAVKFLDWACQQNDSVVDSPETPARPNAAFRRESFTSFAQDERLPQVEEGDEPNTTIPQTTLTEATATTSQQNAGILASVANTVSSYTPQTILNNFPNAQTSTTSNNIPEDDVSDASSTLSSISFASADSHLSTPDSPSTSPKSQTPSSTPFTQKPNQQHQTPHEKELAKLAARRRALDAKHAATLTQLASQSSTSSAKEAAATKKAEERHAREVKKQEARYKREIEKLEARKVKEEKKSEERKKRQGEKDEKERLKRERDELKEKVDVLERERDLWVKQVGELQKENTTLMARMGRMEMRASADDLPSSSTTTTSGDHRRVGSAGSGHSTPTPTPASAPLSTTVSAAADKEKEKGKGENDVMAGMEAFGNRMKAMTFHAVGMGDRLEDGGSFGGGGNRNRSGSNLFRRKERDAHTAADGGVGSGRNSPAMGTKGESASLRSQESGGSAK